MNRKLPGKAFFIFSLSILVLGLIFLSILYYLLYIQYQAPTTYSKLTGPVTTLPKSLRIDLDRPDTDTLSFDQSILVSGKTGPNLEILVTTDSQDLVVKSDPQGNFSTFINLDAGINKLTVAVFDSSGDNRFAQRTIYYSKEKI